MALVVDISLGGGRRLESISRVVLECDPKTSGFPKWGRYRVRTFVLGDVLVSEIPETVPYRRDIGAFELIRRVFQDYPMPNRGELEVVKTVAIGDRERAEALELEGAERVEALELDDGVVKYQKLKATLADLDEEVKESKWYADVMEAVNKFGRAREAERLGMPLELDPTSSDVYIGAEDSAPPSSKDTLAELSNSFSSRLDEAQKFLDDNKPVLKGGNSV